MNRSTATAVPRRPLLIAEGIRAAANRHPGKPAIVCGSGTRSHGELAEQVARIAAAAAAQGLCRGDRVALLAPNCLEYLEIVCGMADAGLTVATLSPRASAREIEAACADCAARLLVVHPDCVANLAGARLASVERSLEIGAEFSAWLAAAGSAPVPAAPLETDPFALVYSSGTTGRPKGILIAHRSRALTIHGMAMEYGCYGPDDLHLGIAPLSHGAGFAFIMASVYFGGTVEILPRFDPGLVLERLGSAPFTGVFMVPAHFQALFGLEPAQLERWRGRAATLRAIISNAAALAQPLKERIVDYFGPGLLHETYGSTEAGIVTNLRPPEQLLRIQSVGRPFALNEVRLLDTAGREVGDGEVGELYSRSPYLFDGYLGQAEETAATLRDGWVSAGDLARRDEHGCYYIVDRRKDMIVTGGFNVYSREVEIVLAEHPDVLDVAVIGVPDERWGEAVEACVVLRAGVALDAVELAAHCRRALADYKVPKRIRTLERLPRNAGGKLLKGELRLLAAAQGAKAPQAD